VSEHDRSPAATAQEARTGEQYAEGGAAFAALERRVVAALRTVRDPELPVNIYDLGLVYALEFDREHARLFVRMTLTAPGCPVAQTFPETVRSAVESVDGIAEARVELVWDPPWSPARMNPDARLALGL
jgi:FeS assembly SUF system protein